ncbi:Hypothetical predicted protein [Mytilus galloprovincialis]|uniref:Uncharacterized protein n=1 Tax=Mytilus galloprovincialis TaxID=29158 RepID=A0A8B6D1B3_MYTGA|nr:Hypothetical predicted protein [Mytilus galloprovincialis]
MEKVESAILVEISKLKNDPIIQINTLEKKMKTDVSNAKKEKHRSIEKKISSEYIRIKRCFAGKKGGVGISKGARRQRKHVVFSTVQLNFSKHKFSQKKVKTLSTFKKEITQQLNCSDRLNITGIAVTTDDKALYCNFYNPECKVYVDKIDQYNLKQNTTLSFPTEPSGMPILTGTDKAVVSLPFESYLQ